MPVRQLFDATSSTYSYLLWSRTTRQAVLVDPVLELVERDLMLVSELGLGLVAVVDTHVHADHVSGAGRIAARTGCPKMVGERSGAPRVDRHLKHEDRLELGDAELEVRETPGHTDGCISLVWHAERCVLTGDALLIRGCGRTDFQQGDAATLYRSVHTQLFSLPGDYTVYPGHDYRGLSASSVDEERRCNPRLGGDRTLEQFVEIMQALSLARPRLIDVAVPSNLRGVLPSDLPVGAPEPPRRDWAPVELTQAGVPELEPEWLARHPRAARLVDVREAAELRGELGHLAQVEHVPLATIGAAARGWDPEQPLILICRSGGRSGKAALELVAAGMTRVASLRGGMLAWRALGLPVVGGEPAPDPS